MSCSCCVGHKSPPCTKAPTTGAGRFHKKPLGVTTTTLTRIRATDAIVCTWSGSHSAATFSFILLFLHAKQFQGRGLAIPIPITRQSLRCGRSWQGARRARGGSLPTRRQPRGLAPQNSRTFFYVPNEAGHPQGIKSQSHKGKVRATVATASGGIVVGICFSVPNVQLKPKYKNKNAHQIFQQHVH